MLWLLTSNHPCRLPLDLSALKRGAKKNGIPSLNERAGENFSSGFAFWSGRIIELGKIHLAQSAVPILR
jgi:hypothetical protein